MARYSLTAGSNVTASSSFATATITPGAGRLVLAFVLSRRAGGAGLPTASGNGLTWHQVAGTLNAAAGNTRITCFRAMGPAPSAGPLTFNFAGQQQAVCAWSVFEYDNVDGTGTDGSGAVLQQQTTSGSGTTLGLTLGPLADAAASLVVGGIVLGVNEAVTPGTGLAQIDLQPFVTATNRGTLQTEDRTGGGSTVNWSWPTTANAGAIALEIKAASVIVPSGPATDAETLARQFEPVLFFSANERFFPADAKRYVEQCALWRAQAPFDAKDSWGGKGGPFPRAPIIDYGKISALAGEPGTPLDSATLVDNQGEERFFDFKGWMDAARMPEPKVTATSKNTFSNRDTIDTVYNKADADGGDQKLRDSRFWYHAELIAADRLRRLLATVRAPDLVKVYDTLQNAALLNYYFFYPAHEESLAGCTNTEGVEFGCCAGQWGCLSLLLERADANSDYRPSYIGTSARLLAAPSMPVAQAADDDDTAKRTVMTVNAFGKATLNDGHPRIFVAKGSHALYLAPGSYRRGLSEREPSELLRRFRGHSAAAGTARDPPRRQSARGARPVLGQGRCGEQPARGARRRRGRHLGHRRIRRGEPRPQCRGHGIARRQPGAGRRRKSRQRQNGATRRRHRARCRRRCAELDLGAKPHDRRSALRLHRRPQHAAVVARRFQSGRLYGPLGTARRDRSLRPARRHALPGFLAPLLPGVCQRESVRRALNGAWAAPGAGGRERATYTHIAQFPQLPERGPPVYVTVWRRSRVKSRLPATG